MYTILGATGNVASKIADILISTKAEDVRLVSRTADRMLPCLLQKTRADLTFYSGDAEAYVVDIMDTDSLTQAMQGSDAVFTLIPPNMKAENFMDYANGITESIGRALERSGVKHVVNLSSIGAELSEGTGPIMGLHNLEQRLNRIKGLNVLHVRAAYFMENLLMNIDTIKSKGVLNDAVRVDLKLPMIATYDIADYVVTRLVNRDFTGYSVEYLLGQRDLSLSEAAAIIGQTIGKPDMKYIALPYDDAQKQLVAAGLSPDMSRSLVEMSRALNEGHITSPAKRPEANTAGMSFEMFCNQIFIQMYSYQEAA